MCFGLSVASVSKRRTSSASAALYSSTRAPICLRLFASSLVVTIPADAAFAPCAVIDQRSLQVVLTVTGPMGVHVDRHASRRASRKRRSTRGMLEEANRRAVGEALDEAQSAPSPPPRATGRRGRRRRRVRRRRLVAIADVVAAEENVDEVVNAPRLPIRFAWSSRSHSLLPECEKGVSDEVRVERGEVRADGADARASGALDPRAPGCRGRSSGFASACRCQIGRVSSACRTPARCCRRGWRARGRRVVSTARRAVPLASRFPAYGSRRRSRVRSARSSPHHWDGPCPRPDPAVAFEHATAARGRRGRGPSNVTNHASSLCKRGGPKKNSMVIVRWMRTSLTRKPAFQVLWLPARQRELGKVDPPRPLAIPSPAGVPRPRFD